MIARDSLLPVMDTHEAFIYRLCCVSAPAALFCAFGLIAAPARASHPPAPTGTSVTQLTGTPM